MSTFLYRLGHAIARFRGRVVTAWVMLAVIIFGLSGLFGGKLVDDFTIPGSESQRGIDTLAQRFPQASGTTGLVLYQVKSGKVADQKAAIEDRIKAIGKVKHVTSVDDPFASGAVGTVSADGRVTLSQIQFDVGLANLPDDTVTLVEHAAKPPAGSPLTLVLGGSMYANSGVGVGVTDVIGVVVAFIVLAVTFSSLLAAGLPLVTAILGVAATLASVLVVASFSTVSSSTPTLALMIGLAVGIDYGLFVVIRHRRQLATGLTVPESIAQALATAGSAVVFAGVTVIIALCGLSVAQIPFLSVMGLAAAAGVAVAVIVALTLLPAVLTLFGEKLRPRPGSRTTKLMTAATSGHRTMGRRWVAIVTKVPVLTVVLVLGVVAVLAWPAQDLRLSLTDNGSAEPGTPQRVSYDLVSSAFGPGYNAPLLVTSDIITSTDPRGAVSKLADDIAALPGVVAITKQTPNPTGDLGLVRVVPQWPQSDPRTADLVQRIRARAPAWEKDLKVNDVLVTGQTAVAIDVSSRLSGALLPFGIVVVGLALILLMIVFRSVAVPIKATVGYLFSIAAALGCVTAVFTWGWLAGALHVTEIGPVVSFMPIILMGVLFGLAMDYEVFLVSAIREDYVHHHDARHAITTGFTSSARVVTAAAIIMFSVFAAFIPEGNSTIKPIAVGLAVGVFVDAFLIRMTLVPAVLALLGERAWWFPRVLDRALPTIDIEGEALVRHVAQDEWEQTHGVVAVRAEQVLLDGSDGPYALDLQLPRGSVTGFSHTDPRLRSSLAWTLAGWHPPGGGDLAVLSHVLPEEAGLVRRRVRVVGADRDRDQEDGGVTVRRHVATLLRAQSPRSWVSPRQRRSVLATAEQWLAELGVARPASEPLGRRPLAQLGPLERRLLELSAAVSQHPGLVVVADADEGLDAHALRHLDTIGRRLAADSGLTVLLCGAALEPLAGGPAEQTAEPVGTAAREAPEPAEATPAPEVPTAAAPPPSPPVPPDAEEPLDHLDELLDGPRDGERVEATTIEGATS